MFNRLSVHDARMIESARIFLIKAQSALNVKNTLLNLISKNNYWRSKQCINMVAAEAPMSKSAQSLLSTDLGTRTAGGHIGAANRYFCGTQYIDQIEAICHATLKTLFDCNYIEHRVLGGTQASQVVYTALTKPGDTIIAVTPEYGGDSSNTSESMPGILGLNVIPMIFKSDHVSIDIVKLEQLINTHRPRLISIGFSVCLFNIPWCAITKLCKSYNVLIYYDAAHELGLIAGKQFINPFKYDIDIISGSTGKTFSGPQGGLLLWNRPEITHKIVNTTFPGFVGTYPLNRVAALAVSSVEMLQDGQAYMAQIVKNAKSLAGSLDELGFDVFAKKRGFTETHQLLVNTMPGYQGRDAAERLAECNMITSAVSFPGDRNIHQNNGKGIRLSTTEITRRGMRESEMKIIAELIYRALMTNELSNHIVKDAIFLSKKYSKIKFC